jgi:hypothetical protein
MKEIPRFTLEYDTAFAPVSYDLVTSLAILRAHGLKRFGSAEINVIIKESRGRRVGIEANYDDKYVRKKTIDVLIGIASRCAWVKSFALIDRESDISLACNSILLPTAEAKKRRRPDVPEWVITPYSVRQLEDAYQDPLYPFLQDGFVPSDASLRWARSILPSDSTVLHPRSSLFSEERNTPVALFEKLARRVSPSRVFMVPDIEGLASAADWEAIGITPIPEAAGSLDLRLALATACKLNVMWNAGNSYPLHFSGVNFIIFGVLNSLNAISTEAYFRRKGPFPYRNPPWFGTNQHYDWTDAVILSADYVSDTIFSYLQNLD